MHVKLLTVFTNVLVKIGVKFHNPSPSSTELNDSGFGETAFTLDEIASSVTPCPADVATLPHRPTTALKYEILSLPRIVQMYVPSGIVIPLNTMELDAFTDSVCDCRVRR